MEFVEEKVQKFAAIKADVEAENVITAHPRNRVNTVLVDYHVENYFW